MKAAWAAEISKVRNAKRKKDQTGFKAGRAAEKCKEKVAKRKEDDDDLKQQGQQK